ncbi:MAG: hypothetical protein DRJ05_09970 [Bacteroidetes bacterium]|nr:MAG: hypothetical protein DRJ05_09970 [Bacteroidota bacterium]
MIKWPGPYHKDLYFIALLLMVVSLPLSKFGMSVAQFGLAISWLWGGKFKKKFNRLWYNIPATVLISFYLLHVIGLIYSSDIDYALKDLRIKLPLLILPLILATTEPLGKKKFHFLLLMYIAAVVGGTLVGFGVLITKDIGNIREISPFMSHIRFGLNVCMAIFVSVYFTLIYIKEKRVLKWVFLAIMVWLIVFLILSKSATGFYALSITGLFVSIYAIIKLKKSIARNFLVTAVILVPLFIFSYLFIVVQDYFSVGPNELANLETKTPNGNKYLHDTVSLRIENGQYIGVYICEPELREIWKKRSSIDFDGQDLQSQKLKFTLIRYLNSKGLRKDRQGIESLSDKDIRNVEKGIANVVYTKNLNLKPRIYKLLWEFQVMKANENPGGHSLLQRIEFWKASIGIIKENFWIGVGTGDIEQAFEKQYEEHQSYLAPEFRHRAHNQYLAIFVSFGVLGLMWFIFSLIYPALKNQGVPTSWGLYLKGHKGFDYLYFVFFSILILSMFYEDTLETQAGVTFYAFLNSLLLFVRKK